MKLRDYEDWVDEQARYPLKDINYSFVGLAGECGEALEWHKKRNLRDVRGNNLTEDDLKSELGDVLHYLVRISRFYGWSVKDLIKNNVEKIEARRLLASQKG